MKKIFEYDEQLDLFWKLANLINQINLRALKILL